MTRMLGRGVALTMVLYTLVACGGSSPTGPTTSASIVDPALTVVGASTYDTDLDGTVVADGDDLTPATQLVASM